MMVKEPCGYPFMSGAPPEEHRKWFLKKAGRKFERQGRHNFSVFSAAQYRELMGVSRSAPFHLYVMLMESWHPFEVPYDLHIQTPPCITYTSTGLIGGSRPDLWLIVRTELAWCAADEFVKEARQGWLWSLP